MKKPSKTQINQLAALRNGPTPTRALRHGDQLHALARPRRRIAEQARLLAERDLEARLLCLEIATELRGTGRTKTDAETAAKAHPRYLAHERGTLELSFARALSEAEGEALVFQLKLACHDSAAATTTVLAAATLLAPSWARMPPAARPALVAEALRLVRRVWAVEDAPAREPRAAVAPENGPRDAA